MKISVIMAAFNSEATIAQAIESFVAQDYPDKELLVSDGGSRDRTVEIARSFANEQVLVVSEPDDGLYDGMNKGLGRMSGAGFGCLNSDDIYASPRSLSLVAAALQECDVVSGALRFFKDDDPERTLRLWRPRPFVRGAFAKGYTLPHPSTYARRAVYDAVGKFSTVYRSASDYDWLLRALELHGFRHATLDQVLVDMRIGGQSTNGLGAIIANSREMLQIRQTHLRSGRIDKALFLNVLFKARQVVAARIGHP